MTDLSALVLVTLSLLFTPLHSSIELTMVRFCLATISNKSLYLSNSRDGLVSTAGSRSGLRQLALAAAVLHVAAHSKSPL